MIKANNKPHYNSILLQVGTCIDKSFPSTKKEGCNC